jgi:basic amino acid/polyamine antiporter, APA family
MSTTAEQAGAGKGLFVRNSTGLVRELSPFDALNLILAAVLFPIGITQIMGFAPVFWPQGNMFVAFLVATPLVTCFALVYLYFTVLMPRAGGDYVWVSRTLHPMAGFVTNFSLTFVYLTWVSLNFTLMFSLLAPAFGYVAGIDSPFFMSPSKGEIMLVSTIATVVFAGLMMIGVRTVARFMAIMFAVVWVGMIAWLLWMLFGRHTGFVDSWNAKSGATYAGIIAQAKALGFSNAGGISWTATLFAMVYCFQVYPGFQWTGYVAGEIKDIRRTANFSILGGLIISAVTFMGGVLLIYKFYGFRFFGSVVYMGLGGGSDHWKLSFSPYLSSLVNFLPGPHFLAVFMSLCFLLAIFWWAPAGFLAGTRNMFAWSFDHLAPEGLTRVSDRFHTPVIATVVIAAVIELLNYLAVYQGFANYLLNILMVMAGAFFVVSIAAALTPYRHAEIHADAPGWARRKIWGVPIITPVAIVSAVSWVFVIWVAFHTGFGGTLSAKPMLEALAAPIIAVVWYLVAWAYRRSQGVSFSKVFAEIPPE